MSTSEVVHPKTPSGAHPEPMSLAIVVGSERGVPLGEDSTGICSYHVQCTPAGTIDNSATHR